MKIINKLFIIIFILIVMDLCLKFKENILDPSTLRGFIISQCLPYPKKYCPFNTNTGNETIFIPAIGELDPSFGNNGITKVIIGTGDAFGKALALQTGGSIFAAGYALNSNDDYAVMKLNGNGSLDNSFGSGGTVVTFIGSGADQAYAIALQSDGKILVAGSYFNSSYDFAIVRYNPDGSFDTSFGSGGKVLTNINYTDDAYAISIQSDGKILVAGTSDNDFAIVRYNPDGSFDNDFEIDGIVTKDIGSGTTDQAYAISIQSDGKILVAGTSNDDFAIVRYNSNGSNDNGFDVDGIVTTDIGSGTIDIANAIALQSDGKILVAGTSNDDFAIVRYNPDGSFDNSFGVNGKFTLNINNTDIGSAVIQQPDGKILVAGTSNFVANSTGDFTVIRLNSDGTLDSSFGSGGKFTVDIGIETYDVASGMVLQPDGRILVVGSSRTTTYLNFCVIRIR